MINFENVVILYISTISQSNNIMNRKNSEATDLTYLAFSFSILADRNNTIFYVQRITN